MSAITGSGSGGAECTYSDRGATGSGVNSAHKAPDRHCWGSSLTQSVSPPCPTGNLRGKEETHVVPCLLHPSQAHSSPVANTPPLILSAMRCPGVILFNSEMPRSVTTCPPSQEEARELGAFLYIPIPNHLFPLFLALAWY